MGITSDLGSEMKKSLALSMDCCSSASQALRESFLGTSCRSSLLCYIFLYMIYRITMDYIGYNLD